jgi:glycosyltransferase involved in cell wall biosynthesis
VYSGFPNVLTIHGNMVAIAALRRARIGSYHWFAARLETQALRKTGGVFCNSAYTESLVAPRARRTWRVPNPIRPAFLTEPSAAPRGERPILLNVGIVQPRKRQTEILAVARKLWQRGFRFEMQFIGALNSANAYEADFARRLAEAAAAGYARHLGTFRVNELVAAFDGAAALVHFPCEEAFGLVVAEALARNLKFFGASVGGIVEIAARAEGAALFPENDWPGLENAIAAWIQAGCPRPAAASQLMRSRYEPKLIARRHVEIYREVLSTRS